MQGTSRIGRNRAARWALRTLLVLAASELSLRLMGELAPRLTARARDTSGTIVCIGDSNTCGVGVLTYLNFEQAEPNGRLRVLAARHGWPLVDLHALHSREELSAEEKRRYFSADRSHPNEAGHGLMARAAFEVLREHRVVR
jgi:lysophospholipase L1-like esterase